MDVSNIYTNTNLRRMKNLFFFLFLTLTPALLIGQNDLAISSCCSGENAKCTGSSYCRACTNCSRCGHCNSGGSCGVCSGSTSGTRYKSSSISRTTGSQTNNTPMRDFNMTDDTKSKNYLKLLIVDAQTLNLRNGPGTNYSVKVKLQKNQELLFLAKTGDWLKVRTQNGQLEGFVNSNYILISEE
ncbi:SH3 domain-containing protein [Autumnicola tepida]|uniref:SH3 domain-containing protein n=1 Tax=Autumnicola tepida TaxID=3075595 RepID=UPI003D77890C